MPHINFKNCSSFTVAFAVLVLMGIPVVGYAQSCQAGYQTLSSRGVTTCRSYANGSSQPPTQSNTTFDGGTKGAQGGIGADESSFSAAGGLDGRLAGNGGVGGNGNNTTQSLKNPLQFKTFDEFFTGLLRIIVIFAIPIIILMIIYSGFLYVMARGNEEQVTKATRALTYAVLGGLIILGAELILQVIQGTVSQLTV